MSHLWMNKEPHFILEKRIIYATWLIHIWKTTHLYMRNDPFIFETCLIYLPHKSFICDMTHSRMTRPSYTWHDVYTSFICKKWIVHVCDMTRLMSHVWIYHVSHMNESCHTHQWVMVHIWINHVTRMNQSCHTYEWVMVHIWMIHVTHNNESCHTYEWVMSHIWINHVTHMNESCHTYQWVMVHIWIYHVTHMNVSCHTYEWVVSHRWWGRGWAGALPFGCWRQN